MPRPYGTLPRAIGAVVAIGSLALAACSKSSSPSVTPTPTPTVTVSGAPTPTAAANTSGIAYLPDGGSGVGFQGIQVVHFEDLNGNLLAAPQPVNIRFSGAVGVVGFTTDATDVVAILSGTGGPPYMQAQDIFGGSVGSLVPVGATYNIAVQPTANPSATPTATPFTPPVVPDAYSIQLLGTTSTGLALVTGAGATGFLGLTSLTNAPPQFGGFVPFFGGSVSPPLYPRTNVVLSTDGAVGLLRGPLDLVAFSITDVSSGYQFKIVQYDGTLGYQAAGTTTLLRGDGAMAISPNDSGRALLAQAPPPYGVQLITGLPTSMTHASSVSLASRGHAVAITPNGAYGIVGADAGFYVISGVATGTISVMAPFAGTSTSGQANSPAYVACDGNVHNLQNITGVAFASTGKYLVLLGTSPGLSCPSGYNSSIVVIPFNESSGSTPSPAPTPTPTKQPQPGSSPSPTASPIPTQFTQNGIITQPSDSSLMVVR